MLQQITAVQDQPNNRQIARREASAPRRVTGKLRTACNHLVHDGMALDEAAEAAGLPTRRLRLALEKAHVLSYLRQQREVLRASMCGKNIMRLAEIRDAADNMPAVNAIKVLEQLGDEHNTRGSGVSDSPGVTIQILNVAAPGADILTKTVASE